MLLLLDAHHSSLPREAPCLSLEFIPYPTPRKCNFFQRNTITSSLEVVLLPLDKYSYPLDGGSVELQSPSYHPLHSVTLEDYVKFFLSL